MKQYVVDQLRELDYNQIQDHLNETAEHTPIEGIYWAPIPVDLYSQIQLEHTQCQPYYFAISLDMNQLSSELLIRSRQTLRCSCIGYATPQQREYIIRFTDKILERFQITL
jgi:hypothetical protein